MVLLSNSAGIESSCSGNKNAWALNPMMLNVSNPVMDNQWRKSNDFKNCDHTLYPQIVACIRIILDCPNWQSELLLQLVCGGVRTCICSKFPGGGTTIGLETTLKESFLPYTKEPTMIFASSGKNFNLVIQKYSWLHTLKRVWAKD